MRRKGTSYRILIAAACLAIISPSLLGQEEREYIRKGNRLYGKSEFAGSEGMYRRAQEEGKSPADVVFNLGDALYKQKRYGEAATEFSRAALAAEADSVRQAEVLYNLGNSLLKDQKFSESIDAYINSLKLNPDNIQAKYNLAYAQDQMKKQEKQQQQQQDKNKDEQQDQDNKDQKKQDDQQKEKQDQPEQNDQQQDNRDQQQQQQQQQQSALSREDARRLLDALAANEEQTQEKVQREKAAKARVRVIKNW